MQKPVTALQTKTKQVIFVKIRCIWEHNKNDTLLYAADHIGAYTRGPSLDIAVKKMSAEIMDYTIWKDGAALPCSASVEIIQDVESSLDIKDADSDALFETETSVLTQAEYTALKELTLKSARDFLTLYDAVPDKKRTCLNRRKCFYGQVPITAEEMYEHTKSVNTYYFNEINVEADNVGSIYECRANAFAALEKTPDYLENALFNGSYGESWTLRKVMRRFIWHDRIHAKAMYRMAVNTFGADAVPNIFHFTL